MDPTVAVIAADATTRERLVRALSAGRLPVATATGDALDVPGAPDVVVVACPVADPTPALVQAASVLADSRLVGVLAGATRHSVRRAVRAGAAALVQEDDIEAALALAVRSAFAGQLSIPFDVADGLEKPVLSSREKQILGMVVMGFTNNQIARQLFLAESTVKSHLSSIFSKLGVASRKEAAAIVTDPEEGLGMGILSISDETPLGPAIVEREESAA